MKDVKAKVKYWVNDHNTQIKVVGGATLGVIGCIGLAVFKDKVFLKRNRIMEVVKFTDEENGLRIFREDIFGRKHLVEVLSAKPEVINNVINDLAEALNHSVDELANNPEWFSSSN